MIGWFDGSAGASGDMVLGALVGAGVPIEVMAASVELLGLPVELGAQEVTRGGIGATQVRVGTTPDPTVRGLADILALLDVLPAAVRDLATTVFERLARAEAAVHRVAVEEVRFHEVGALDSMADVVGAAAGLVHLDLDAVLCSRLSLGSGTARGAHGPLPVPVPAVLELLAGSGAPVRAGPAPLESTTPTGAALLVSVVDEWAELPPMTVEAVGAGAGSADPDELANVLRLVIGEPAASFGQRPALLIEANVDDLDPRAWPEAIASVLAAGAQDAWTTPITMKKGRPAIKFCALCSETDAPQVRAAIFGETSTIGVRETPVVKHELARSQTFVEVRGHRIGVKIACHAGEVVNRSVEWEDVRVAAEALALSAKEVLVLANAEAVGLWPTGDAGGTSHDAHRRSS